MDENAQSPNPTNPPQGTQPVNPPTPFQGGSPGSVPFQPQVPQQPASDPTGSGGTRLTLEDLYGSSQPNEIQPAQPGSLPANPPSQSPVQQQPPQQNPFGSSQPMTSAPPSAGGSVPPVLPPSLPQQAMPAIPPVQEVAPTPPQAVTPPPTSPSPSSDMAGSDQTQSSARRQPEQLATPEVPNQPAAAEQIPSSTGASNETPDDPKNSGGGGFHITTILRFLVGGVIFFIVLLIVWAAGSMLFSHSGSQSGNVTLTYWGLWEDPRVIQPILDDFHKQHPNITVTYTMEDPKDYTKRLLTRAQDGTGPDIFRFHNTWVYPLQSLLLPLPTQVIDKQQLGTVYPPVISHDLIQNGAVYGLPLQMDTLTLFVNTDIFTHAGASVPTTWDNFITVAKALTVKDPSGKIQTAGAAIGIYDNVEHAPDIISLLLLQNGASLQKLSPSQNTNDALTFYSSFAKGEGNVWDNTLDNSLNEFATGKAAMYFGYSYDIFAIKAISPTLNFKTYPVPHLPGRNITIASYWVEGVSNRSKHQKEALEFMQYLAQKDVEEKLYTEETKTRSFGELYARSDLADQLKANPLVSPFITQYKDAASSFFSDNTDYDEYNGALNQYLGNALKSMVQDTSVDSAASTLSQGVSQVMNTYASKTP